MADYRRYAKKTSNTNTTSEPEADEEWDIYADEGERLDGFPDEGEVEITAVTPLRKPRHHYKLTFGELNLMVHEDVMIKYRLLKGMSFSKEELENIVIANERQTAYAEALNYLSRKARTRTEIARKLKEKEIHPEIIETTLVRLQQEKLIDDELYAQQWAKQRVNSQKKGKVLIRQELRQKGVNKENIEQALEEIDPNDEIASATILAEKKWKSTSGEVFDKKRKTMAFLMRRGYSSDIVRKALDAVQQKPEDDWE